MLWHTASAADVLGCFIANLTVWLNPPAWLFLSVDSIMVMLFLVVLVVDCTDREESVTSGRDMGGTVHVAFAGQL